MTEVNLNHSYDLLYSDTCIIIEEARNYAYRAVNIALTLRNWQLGERIARENLDGAERAEYGKKIITELSRDLTNKYGKGFDRISLYNYLKFYRCFPEIVGAVSQQSQIVGAVSQQSENVAALRQQFGILDSVNPKLLPWTHYRELIRVEDAEAREWYEMVRKRSPTRNVEHSHVASQHFIAILLPSHAVWKQEKSD